MVNPRPNILFILADDMRASDLDYMPNTHNLLTNQGVKFTKARGGDRFALVPLKSDHPHRPVLPQPWSVGQRGTFRGVLELP